MKVNQKEKKILFHTKIFIAAQPITNWKFKKNMFGELLK